MRRGRRAEPAAASMRFARGAVERLYARVSGEPGGRKPVSEDARRDRDVPANFFLILTSLVLTKLGDLLVSPKIVLAWLLNANGVPASMIAWMVPIRESGSMIPQIAIGAWVRRRPRRGWVWVLGSVLQGACVAGMAVAVWLYDGMAAGLLVMGLLALFSLSRALSSVASKDVQGKCIPKARRGRLNGLAATGSGIATIGVSIWLLDGRAAAGEATYLVLLLGAAGLWWLAAGLFSLVREAPGETAGGKDAVRDTLKIASLLVDDAPFRNFVITRALLMGSALSSPFFVLIAQRAGSDARLLGGFVLASALASTLSGAVWGWMADSSSRRVMVRAGTLSAGVCIFCGTASWSVTAGSYPVWLWPIAYFVLNIAHAGVRIGRKTYVVDMAGGTKRTDYVAASNTAIGVLLLLTGGLSAVASILSVEAVLVMLGLMGAAGVVSALRLRDV